MCRNRKNRKGKSLLNNEFKMDLGTIKAGDEQNIVIQSQKSIFGKLLYHNAK
jgi:hypothetical protein